MLKYANPALQDLIGWTPEEIARRAVDPEIHPGNLGKWPTNLPPRGHPVNPAQHLC